MTPIQPASPVPRRLREDRAGSSHHYRECRYADDFVCAFELQADAERFYAVLGSRLEQFGLEVAEEKTNLIRFSPVNWKASCAFEFLGFEFRWGRGRWGKPVIKRRTARKKYRASLASFQDWCRKHCRLPKAVLFSANARTNSLDRACGRSVDIQPRGLRKASSTAFSQAKKTPKRALVEDQAIG